MMKVEGRSFSSARGSYKGQIQVPQTFNGRKQELVVIQEKKSIKQNKKQNIKKR